MGSKQKTVRSWAEGDLLSEQNRRLTRCQLWSEAADKLERQKRSNPFAVFALRWIAFAALFEPLHDKELKLSAEEREQMLAKFIRDDVCRNNAAANVIADALKKNENEILNLADRERQGKLSKKISDREAAAGATQILKIIREFRNHVLHGRINPEEHADRQTASASARILKELTAAFVEAVKA